MDKRKLSSLFENSYNEFSRGIFRYIYFRVSDYELAKDLTSDTFIRYWKVLLKGESIENQKALLYLIAKGLIIDYYRRKKNTNNISIESIDERLLEIVENTEERIYQKQQMEQINLKIKQLKKQYQDVLLLHYVEDLSIKEIASILNRTENAIRVLLHRSLKALQEKL